MVMIKFHTLENLMRRKRINVILFSLLISSFLFIGCNDKKMNQDHDSEESELQKEIVEEYSLTNYLQDKLNSYLKSKNLDSFRIEQILDYARYDEGAKFLPKSILVTMIGQEGFFYGRKNRIDLRYLQQREDVLVGVFGLHSVDVFRILITINEAKSMECLDRLIFVKEINQEDDFISVLDYSFSKDSLLIYHTDPVKNNPRKPSDTHLYTIEKYIIGTNSFIRLK